MGALVVLFLLGLRYCTSFYHGKTTAINHHFVRNIDTGGIYQKRNNNCLRRSLSSKLSALPKDEYNISYDESIENWVANLTPKTRDTEEGVYLGSNDKSKFEVISFSVNIFRSPSSPGLGLELFEIAGGREDGVGITVVSGIIKDGNAGGSGIIPGDSITDIKVVTQGTSQRNQGDEMMVVGQDVTKVNLECRNFDNTVDAILSLPQCEQEQMITITLKRLQRRPRVKVVLQYPPSQDEPDQVIQLFAGENLRRAMLVRGVKLNDNLSRRFDSGGIGDCGAEGTCATCVVAIAQGEDLINPINQQEKQILKKNPKWRLACRTYIGHGKKEGEMTIRVNPRQW